MKFLERSLSKLSLSAFTDRELKHEVGSIEAMYNPDSLELRYQTDYKVNQLINSSIQSNNYATVHPCGLQLELVFDARMPGNKISIEKQLTHLRYLCYTINPSRGEPHFLRIKWGNMRWTGRGYFAGRMTSLSYRYTLFDRDATPLRASVTLSLTADQSIDLQESEQSLQSPPVAVLKVPAGGGGLPLMAANAATVMVGGADYLSLAWSNNLDSLHDIEPGKTLKAPSRSGGRR
jgi:hypothetical protein